MMLFSRRRILSIMAATAGSPLVAFHDVRASSATRWSGMALGARATITIATAGADRAVAMCQAEISRLENIFSLYRSDSVVARLNAAGYMADPPPELLALLAQSHSISQATGGAFDPTVQPLWDLYARHFATNPVDAAGPSEREIARIRTRTAWHNLEFDSAAVRFVKSGMGLTFNGIAQGYIADRVTELLRNENFEHVLVETGEWRALGVRPDGELWRARIRGTETERFVTLNNQALAVSAPRGTKFDRPGRFGHILDPRTGTPGGEWRQVAVLAPTATLADGLSTGLCLLDATAVARVQTTYPHIKVLVT